MSSLAFAELPLPDGPRFTGQSSTIQTASRVAPPRHDLIRRIRAELDRGTYDRPQALATRLDACLDRVLADLIDPA